MAFQKLRLKQIDLTELNDLIDGKIYGKVDKETGKGLSTNDFTNEYKTKLDNTRLDTTKVEQSNINGNIVVDDNEITVYTHPGSGTNPHGTTKSDIGLSNVENKSSATIRSEITQNDIESALDETITSIRDKNFVFTQSIESSQWIIQHNLNKYCMVKTFDEDNNEIYGDISYIDQDNLTISFSKPINGRAFLN